MGGRRVPTKVLEARGTFAHDPALLEERKGEPEPHGPIGPAPEYFDKVQRQCWDEIVKTAHQGTLSDSDQMTVESLALLCAEMRTRGTAFNKHAAMLHLLGRLGMTPADRSLVRARPGEGYKKPNSFSDLKDSK